MARVHVAAEVRLLRRHRAGDSPERARQARRQGGQRASVPMHEGREVSPADESRRGLQSGRQDADIRLHQSRSAVSVYYNEIDKFAAAWLRELMKAGEIPDGEVDERSIELVQPGELRGFT